MKYMKNQKLRDSQCLVKKEKSQNFGLSPKTLKRFFFREEKEGFIVFDSFDSNVFFVNKPSKEILLLIDQNLNKGIIIDLIAKEYNISKNKSAKAVNLIWREFK